MTKTFWHRRERLVLFGLTRGRERSKSSPVKTTQCTDNYVLAATTEFSRKFDARLVCLGPRVAKENLTIYE